jgi:hypothetical protein
LIESKIFIFCFDEKRTEEIYLEYLEKKGQNKNGKGNVCVWKNKNRGKKVFNQI